MEKNILYIAIQQGLTYFFCKKSNPLLPSVINNWSRVGNFFIVNSEGIMGKFSKSAVTMTR